MLGPESLKMAADHHVRTADAVASDIILRAPQRYG